jgi:hypothetical protein
MARDAIIYVVAVLLAIFEIVIREEAREFVLVFILGLLTSPLAIRVDRVRKNHHE